MRFWVSAGELSPIAGRQWCRSAAGRPGYRAAAGGGGVLGLRQGGSRNLRRPAEHRRAHRRCALLILSAGGHESVLCALARRSCGGHDCCALLWFSGRTAVSASGSRWRWARHGWRAAVDLNVPSQLEADVSPPGICFAFFLAVWMSLGPDDRSQQLADHRDERRGLYAVSRGAHLRIARRSIPAMRGAGARRAHGAGGNLAFVSLPTAVAAGIIDGPNPLSPATVIVSMVLTPFLVIGLPVRHAQADAIVRGCREAEDRMPECC